MDAALTRPDSPSKGDANVPVAPTPVTLAIAPAHDWPAFKRELQDAFAPAVVAEFGSLPNGPIPSDQDLDQMMSAPGTLVLRLLRDGEKVGGAVVTIDDATHRNALDLFFVTLGRHGRGTGLGAWLAIERMFPQTRVWQTHTPYFEKRNIHFYVNKCGFKIVEYFNPAHPESHRPDPDDLPGDGGAFRFEKIMEPARRG